MEIKLPTLTCKRCGHEWVPRVKVVTICPSCKSPYWNRPLSSFFKAKKGGKS